MFDNSEYLSTLIIVSVLRFCSTCSESVPEAELGVHVVHVIICSLGIENELSSWWLMLAYLNQISGHKLNTGGHLDQPPAQSQDYC